jgi:hypothetical protein
MYTVARPLALAEREGLDNVMVDEFVDLPPSAPSSAAARSARCTAALHNSLPSSRLAQQRTINGSKVRGHSTASLPCALPGADPVTDALRPVESRTDEASLRASNSARPHASGSLRSSRARCSWWALCRRAGCTQGTGVAARDRCRCGAGPSAWNLTDTWPVSAVTAGALLFLLMSCRRAPGVCPRRVALLSGALALFSSFWRRRWRRTSGSAAGGLCRRQAAAEAAEPTRRVRRFWR